MKQQKKIRLGFDLDGIIVDKPPLVPKKMIERLFKGSKESLSYRFPKSKLEQFIRKLSHFYLFRPAIRRNIVLIRNLKQLKNYQVFLISSRYSFLAKETKLWLKKRRIANIFKEIYLNTENEAPHLFKEKMINKLRINYFFEDDHDIVNYLRKKLQKTEVLLVGQNSEGMIEKYIRIPKLRMLFLLTYYYPYWTGLTAYAQRTAEGLVARDHQVTVLTSRHQKELPFWETFRHVKIIRLKPLFRVSRSFFIPSLLPKLWRQLNEIDVLIIYLPFAEVLPAVILAKIRRKKVFLIHNGDLLLPRGFLNRIIEKTYLWLTKIAIPLADKTVVQTWDFASHSPLLSKVKPKLIQIYPPAEILKPNPQDVANWQKELNLKDKKVIGLVGRFVKEKGFDYLFKAIPLILKTFPQAVILFAGPRQMAYENFYRECIPYIKKYRDKVIFTGLILDRQKMANFYKLLDVFVISSRQDCFPATQVEAMICQVPVVATNIPGTREAIKKTGMGLLVKPNSPKALAKGIIKVLRNPTKYIKPISKNEIFDSQEAIVKYERLFRDD